MKKSIGKIIAVTILAMTLTSQGYASHDNGFGKSQDDKDHLSSVSVAPEPSTFWLFLVGTLMVAAYGFNRKKTY